MESTTFPAPTVTDDDVDGTVVACDPATPFGLGLGEHEVECTATDAGGLTDTCGYSVTITGTLLRACDGVVRLPHVRVSMLVLAGTRTACYFFSGATSGPLPALATRSPTNAATTARITWCQVSGRFRLGRLAAN